MIVISFSSLSIIMQSMFYLKQINIKILTTERIYITDGPAGNITDMVFWRGARYRIVTVTPDIDYGFYRSW